MKNWISVFIVVLAMPVFAAEQAVIDRYNQSCAICHGSGAAGAPKTGVPEEWEARLAKGDEVLLNNVKNGIGAMPPKGMCFDCSDSDFSALIDYMAAPAQ